MIPLESFYGESTFSSKPQYRTQQLCILLTKKTKWTEQLPPHWLLVTEVPESYSFPWLSGRAPHCPRSEGLWMGSTASCPAIRGYSRRYHQKPSLFQLQPCNFIHLQFRWHHCPDSSSLLKAKVAESKHETPHNFKKLWGNSKLRGNWTPQQLSCPTDTSHNPFFPPVSAVKLALTFVFNVVDRVLLPFELLKSLPSPPFSYTKFRAEKEELKQEISREKK